jgi:glucose-6-phosphate isomerase
MSNNPTHNAEWDDLAKHCDEIKKKKIISFFDEDSDRFDTLSQSVEGLFFDYSKQHINTETIEKLCALAQTCDLEKHRDAMFSGEKINITEDRAVLHTILREPDTIPEVRNTLEKIKNISSDIRNKKFKGITNQPIEKVICLGVGGSDLGPRLICDALKTNKDFPVSFVSNIDPCDIEEALIDCNPENTLFLVVSKSFGTQETMANFTYARNWLKQKLESDENIMRHFIAVTVNNTAALDYGFDKDHILPLWEWVNGRFSVWSAVGLSIAIALGFDQFQSFLKGAHKIDTHFKETPFEKNIPVLMALIGIWNINFLNYNQLSILPYTQKLFYLPTYLQQLDMESNGKSVDKNHGLITDYKTGPVLFGEVGTNGQHSFYQHLHQGTQKTPCDFIGFKNKSAALMNNMLAQSEALMIGQSHDDPHQYFKGNIPSSTLIFGSLTAETLGMLIALYEHKIFVQGIIWNINSFDQFGVELGKKLARKLNNKDLSNADPSTKGLYYMINKG